MDIQDKKNILRRVLAEKRGGITARERSFADKEICSRLISLAQYKRAEIILCYVSSRSEPETRPIIEHALAEGKKVACPRCADNRGNMTFHFTDALSRLVPGRFGLMEPDPSVCPAFDTDSVNTVDRRSPGTYAVSVKSDKSPEGKNADMLCPEGKNADMLCPEEKNADMLCPEEKNAGMLCPEEKNAGILCIVPGLSFDRSGGRLGYGKGYYDRFLERFHCTCIGICYERMLSERLPMEGYDRRVDMVVTEARIIFCKTN